jgi:nucleoside-diphosphate-sugar epimerase
MNILVTGSDGYIGAVLCPKLMKAGNIVIGLDTGFYRQGLLFNTKLPYPCTISGDVRDANLKSVQGFDAIIHLAELSNDPLGQNDPEITWAINHRGSVRLAQLAKEAGVRRFIYTSSCSVYGAASGGEVMSETSPVNPQTAYAECKVAVERDIRELADKNFTPVFLRNATAFGASPRMRFDIVLNNLAGLAWTTKEIAMISDGSPWRPLVHVDDICEAIRLCLEAPIADIHNEVFNVGSDAQNYRVRQIAEIIAEVFPGCRTTFGDLRGDNRSYMVSFAKIKRHLPEFECKIAALDGARELFNIFSHIQMTPADFTNPPFTRLKQLERLLKTGQLDRDLRWTIS